VKEQRDVKQPHKMAANVEHISSDGPGSTWCIDVITELVNRADSNT
jgi:hypothetical protein